MLSDGLSDCWDGPCATGRLPARRAQVLPRVSSVVRQGSRVVRRVGSRRTPPCCPTAWQTVGTGPVRRAVSRPVVRRCSAGCPPWYRRPTGVTSCDGTVPTSSRAALSRLGQGNSERTAGTDCGKVCAVSEPCDASVGGPTACDTVGMGPVRPALLQHCRRPAGPPCDRVLTCSARCAVGGWEPMVTKTNSVHFTLVVPVPNLQPADARMRQRLLTLRKDRVKARQDLWKPASKGAYAAVPQETFADQLAGLRTTAGNRLTAATADLYLHAAMSDLAVPKFELEDGGRVDLGSVVHREAFTATGGQGDMAALLDALCSPLGQGYVCMPVSDAAALFTEKRLASRSAPTALLDRVRDEFAKAQPALESDFQAPAGCEESFFVTQGTDNVLLQGFQDDHLPKGTDRTPLMARKMRLDGQRLRGASPMPCATFESVSHGQRARAIRADVATPARVELQVTRRSGVPPSFVEAVENLQTNAQLKLWESSPHERELCPGAPPPTLVICRPLHLGRHAADADAEGSAIGPRDQAQGLSSDHARAPPPAPQAGGQGGVPSGQADSAMFGFLKNGTGLRVKMKAQAVAGAERGEESPAGRGDSAGARRPATRSRDGAAESDAGVSDVLVRRGPAAKRRAAAVPEADNTGPPRSRRATRSETKGDLTHACSQQSRAHAKVLSGALGSVLRNLVVTREWFELMRTGEKRVEYRERTRYWLRRLTDARGRMRRFKYVQICCGYGRKRPYFVARCGPLRKVRPGPSLTFSNGSTLPLDHRGGYIGIGLGQMLCSS